MTGRTATSGSAHGSFIFSLLLFFFSLPVADRAVPRLRHRAMYVGPWQEYRLGQLFGEQSRLLADAVRQQIHQQIIDEQSAQPQIQLHANGGNGRGKPLSYSAALRMQSSHGGGASIASTDSSRSVLTPSSALSSQRAAAYSAASNASQRHAPASALSGASSQSHVSAAMLPPLQAAARAAVHNLQASRVRVAQAHPLAHIVHSYLPDAAAQLASPALSDRSLSRQSSAASSASTAGASTAATAAHSHAYLGNPAHAYYRPPAHALPRKAKKKPSERTSKEVAAAHRQHLTKLRSLYGLQQQQQQQQEQQQEQERNGHEQQQQRSQDARSGASSQASTPAHSMLPRVPTADSGGGGGGGYATGGSGHAFSYPHSPHQPGPWDSSRSGAGNTTPPPMHPPRESDFAGQTRPLVLPPAVMPLMNAQTLALYGPIPDELAASLSFYARPSSPGPQPGQSAAPKEPQPSGSAAPASGNAPPLRSYAPVRGSAAAAAAPAPAAGSDVTPSWLATLSQDALSHRGRPISRDRTGISLHAYGDNVYSQRVIASPTPPPGEDDGTQRPQSQLRSHSRAAQHDAASARPVSRGNPPLLQPLSHTHGRASIDHDTAAAAALSNSSSASRLPPSSVLSPSASQLRLAEARAPGQKMSMEARMRQEHARQAATRAAAPAESDSRSRTPSRLLTPLHQQSLSIARSQLRSSSGLSESGDFESEVNDLLGWASELQC